MESIVFEWLANNALVIETNWLFSWNKWRGFGFIPFIILVENSHNTRLIRHEQAHQYQLWRGYIIITIVRYIIGAIIYGYKLNRFELKAKAYSNREISLKDTY